MAVKKTLTVIIALLIALTSLTSSICVSALQNLSNTVDMNRDASVSASSINTTYNNLKNKVNSAVNTAELKISQLYDLNFEFVDSCISQAKSELDKANALKNNILSKLETNPGSAEINTLLTDFNNTATRIESLCESITVASVESKAVSARSTWYRPC